MLYIGSGFYNMIFHIDKRQLYFVSQNLDTFGLWEGCEWEADVTGVLVMPHYVNTVIWRACSYKKYKIGGIHLETTVKEVGTVKESRYRRAKTWQIGAFALNNTATVSYTHLTLPTKRIVQISVGAVQVTKKQKRNKT
eukprot:TRINITY_DN24117_c0_g1_i1.p2 TRINITY_DN24117_c0_g1~~TRINITY_DN24117_c0_g1_i1.p2  ORF type:complete len:138 (+),score=10.33 TRINITY_DN24117_c0_g1_i1:121-534(+)